MNRKFRLTQSTDFKRVRRSGRSYAHPLIVLVVIQAEGEQTQIGVTAGRSVGGAVQRNRAKRRVREALRKLIPLIKPGRKAILISRKPLLAASFTEIIDCLHQLFTKANLLLESHE